MPLGGLRRLLRHGRRRTGLGGLALESDDGERRKGVEVRRQYETVARLLDARLGDLDPAVRLVDDDGVARLVDAVGVDGHRGRRRSRPVVGWGDGRVASPVQTGHAPDLEPGATEIALGHGDLPAVGLGDPFDDG